MAVQISATLSRKRFMTHYLTSFDRFDRQNSKLSDSVAKLGNSYSKEVVSRRMIEDIFCCQVVALHKNLGVFTTVIVDKLRGLFTKAVVDLKKKI